MNGPSPDSKSATSSAPARPVVVDLGKRKRRLVKELREGRGPLVDEVLETVRQVRTELGEDPDRGQTPIVVLYERRKKRKRSIGVGFPFCAR